MPGYVQPAMPTGVTDISQDISAMLLEMPGGKAYLGEQGGVATKTEMDANCSSQTQLSANLGLAFLEIGSKLAEDAGSFESNPVELKYHGGSLPGKRITKVNVNILGVSPDQKAYFESDEFEKVMKALVLVDESGENAIMFQNAYLRASLKGKIGGLWTISLSCEYIGKTTDNVGVYPNIPVGGVG